MGDSDCVGAFIAGELEAGLNPTSDPTSEFVTQGGCEGYAAMD